MKKILTLIAIFAMSESAFAVTQNSGSTTISNIITYPSAAIVKVTRTHTNKDNCSNGSSGAMLILPLTPTTKAQYSALLSAYVAKKNVVMTYSGCVATLPRINSVILR